MKRPTAKQIETLHATAIRVDTKEAWHTFAMALYNTRRKTNKIKDEEKLPMEYWLAQEPVPKHVLSRKNPTSDAQTFEITLEDGSTIRTSTYFGQGQAMRNARSIWNARHGQNAPIKIVKDGEGITRLVRSVHTPKCASVRVC